MATTILGIPVVDLGDQDERFRSIFKPVESKDAVAGVTDQFLENAASYHERYFNTAYLDWLIGNALDSIKVSRPPELILDIEQLSKMDLIG